MTNQGINEIGATLVKCDLHCGGIINDPYAGIIPRGLLFEKGNDSGSCIVVGLNPGKAKDSERKYYLDNKIGYSTIEQYFKDHLKRSNQYFLRTRKMLTTLGFEGGILWTNLAKCQCSGDNGKLPMQTLRVCINQFLQKEVKEVKADTIFALGNDSYSFCALSFPNHFVVGVPHPTGSHGHFFDLQKKIDADPARYKNILRNKQDETGRVLSVKLSEV